MANDTALHDRNDRTEALTMLQAAAFTEWYEMLAPHLIRWLEARGVFAASIAEDITQDTFIRVLGHVAHISTLSDAHRRNYIFTAAAHILAERVRDTDRHQRMSGGAALAVPLSAFKSADDLSAAPVTASEDWTANATQMEQTTAARMTLLAVWRAVPVEQRELLLMACYGYSYGEIMARLHISHGALGSQLWRLRQMLRAVREQVA